MILETLAEAFQGEYDVDGSHTACISHAKEALTEQQKTSTWKLRWRPWSCKSDTDLEETDVQEIPLANKQPRQLRS